MDCIEGSLEKIVFENHENGFMVARFRQSPKNKLTTVVGNLGSVHVGEALSLEGEWVENKKFGPQFKVNTYIVKPPSSLEGIAKYLGSGVVKGIGPVMAERIVEMFGLEALDILENHPLLLSRVEGLGRKRIKQIKKEWDNQKESRDVMIFLQGHGITPVYSMKIFKRYGKESVQKVQENPYRLAQEIFGIGFLTADKIARNLGVEVNSPLRARAGLIYVMTKYQGDGHVYVPELMLLEQAEKILQIELIVLEEALNTLYEKKELIVDRDEDNEKIVYLKVLYLAETGVAERIKELCDGKNGLPEVDIEAEIAWAEKEEQIELAPLQREAVFKALKNKVMVITGGPGTGKTTILKTILMILKKMKASYRLAAPTGRAAKRMREATGGDASTLHRLLEFNPKGGKFQRDFENPLEEQVVIVDETSMLDIVLAFYFFKAVEDKAHVILVGDIDQLPSVGPGSVLKNIIDSGVTEVVKLSEIFRQAEKSLTIVNAHRINQGQLPIIKKPEGDEIPDFFFVEKDDPKEVAKTIKQLVLKRIPEKFNFDPVDDIQILSPMYKGAAGVDEINSSLQTELNAEAKFIERGDRIFREGDKVMQIRNNYDKEVFNGDIGRVFDIDNEEQEVAVDFLGTIVRYDYLSLDELKLAYSISVHKSQGSEFRAVIVPLTTEHYIMLQRNLLYTAITRGKELVVLVGSTKALRAAVRNDQIKNRFTNLKSFLIN